MTYKENYIFFCLFKMQLEKDRISDVENTLDGPQTKSSTVRQTDP